MEDSDSNQITRDPNTVESTHYNRVRRCFERPEHERLLPRPVPDNDAVIQEPVWWEYLPKPVQDFLSRNKWYFLVGILLITLMVTIVLFYTGNFRWIPVVLRTSICFIMSSYFDKYCGPTGDGV